MANMKYESLIESKSDRPIIVDLLLINRMRLLLACAGLLVVYIDPASAQHFIADTYIVLALYIIYCAILLAETNKQSRISRLSQTWAHWADLGWYALLFSFGRGPGGLFFFGFLFVIITASFAKGYRAGLQMTLTSAAIFTVLGLITFSNTTDFELNRFLMRPIYLTVMGYMISYWGGYEIRLNRRLILLKNLGQLSNPRFGVNRTVGSIASLILDYFRAEGGLLLMKTSASEYSLHRLAPNNQESSRRAELLATDQAKLLLSLPEKALVVYGSASRGWRRSKPNHHVFDLVEHRQLTDGLAESETAAELLDTESFISVPLTYRNESLGRIYLTRQHHFNEQDARFLLQVMEHALPIIDNAKLIDDLAQNAAEAERKRIARDIHDSIIQPYIGLSLGLSAIQRKIEAGDQMESVSAELSKLSSLAETGIDDLRLYVRALKTSSDLATGLVPALNRFTNKFTEATGIRVELDADEELQLEDRLATEAFQIVAEGLSNIRRHTNSQQASVKIANRNGLFALTIENDHEAKNAPASFTPRSIAERVEALNGQIQIALHPQGRTTVFVEIPI